MEDKNISAYELLLTTFGNIKINKQNFNMSNCLVFNDFGLDFQQSMINFIFELDNKEKNQMKLIQVFKENSILSAICNYKAVVEFDFECSESSLIPEINKISQFVFGKNIINPVLYSQYLH